MAALRVVTTIDARRRALAQVPPELRHPVLYLPLSFTNATTLAIGRRLQSVVAGGTAIRPGIRVEQHTVHATATDTGVPVVTYQAPTRNRPRGALLWIHGGGTV